MYYLDFEQNQFKLPKFLFRKSNKKITMKILQKSTLIFLLLSSSYFVSAQSNTQESINYVEKYFPFDYEIILDRTPVKDQYYSGTCWSFGTISFLESELIRQGKGKWDLSEMYIAYFSYLEKVKKHAQSKGETFFTAGGQCHDVMFLIEEVGIIPEQIYDGKNGRKNHVHDQMDTLMQREMNKILAAGLTQIPEENLNKFKEIMQNHMGKIPEEFTWINDETYTPLSFKKEVLKLSAEDYIELTSYTHHSDYQYFILESPYNWRAGEYYNLPFKTWIEVIDNALANGYSLAWNGDVTEETFLYEYGLAILPENTPEITAELRQKTFEDKSSQVDHVMHIIGTAKSKTGEDFYIIKNSWGKTNNIEGYLLMSKKYFMLKTVSVTLNKEALPQNIQEKL